MKIVLDFDRTLFDVDKLYTELKEKNIYELVGTVESLDHLEVPELVFDDVEVFLNKFDIKDIVVLSSYSGTTADWTQEYQAEKIRRSKIVERVGEVIVMAGAKDVHVLEIAERFPEEAIIFVDDQVSHCMAVKKAVPACRCFCIRRDLDFAEKPQELAEVETVTSLADIVL